MKKSLYLKTAILVVLSATVVTGCSNNDSGSITPPVVVTPPPAVPPPPPPPPPAGADAPQDNFGASFKTAFEQNPYAEPIDPVAGDIIPLDKTAEPFDVPNPM